MALSVVTGSNEPPAGLGAPVPGSRTESPQPVSSARRRLSTDEMQLREVGKLAVYLRKIRWLQRPSHRALPWAVRCGWLTPGMAALLGLSRAGRVGCRLRCANSPRQEAVWAFSPGPAPVSTWWLTWNCCCAGESDCLIETQLCEGTSWLVP